MLAYKFLSPERRTAMTDFRWPESDWVEVDGPLERCRNGVHACRVDDLAHWLGMVMWTIELDGDIIETDDAVVARRGRLLAPVRAWVDGGGQEFADNCARRATALSAGIPSAAERAGDGIANATNGNIPVAAYVAAAVAGEVASGTRHGPLYMHYFLGERTRQAWWLQDRLALPAG